MLIIEYKLGLTSNFESSCIINKTSRLYYILQNNLLYTMNVSKLWNFLQVIKFLLNQIFLSNLFLIFHSIEIISSNSKCLWDSQTFDIHFTEFHFDFYWKNDCQSFMSLKIQLITIYKLKILHKQLVIFLIFLYPKSSLENFASCKVSIISF